jgi:hypothetical protein
MTRRVRCALALAACIACVASSCAPTDVTLATVAAGGDGGGFDAYCTSVNDCQAGFYCELPTCGAPSGKCSPLPASCDNEEHDTCGCDGITYFNDCMRKQRGVGSVYYPSPCPADVAYTCGPGQPACPQPAYCFEVAPPGPGGCLAGPQGSCWVIPLDCPPPSPQTIRWDNCSEAQRCVDTCRAIEAQVPFKRGFGCH